MSETSLSFSVIIIFWFFSVNVENVAALTEWAFNHLTNLRDFFESDDLERAQFYIAEVNVPPLNWKNRNVNFGEKKTDNISLPLLNLSLPTELFKTKRPLMTKKDGSCLFNSLSLALMGTEDYAIFFRLLAAMYMISNSDECEGLMTTAAWRQNVESYKKELAYTLARSGTGSAFTIEVAGRALDIAIESLFPNFGDASAFANYRNTNNRIFNADQVNHKQITILWCSTYKIQDDLFAFNHFVPIVNCDPNSASKNARGVVTAAAKKPSHQQPVAKKTKLVQEMPIVFSKQDTVSSFCREPLAPATPPAATVKKAGRLRQNETVNLDNSNEIQENANVENEEINDVDEAAPPEPVQPKNKSQRGGAYCCVTDCHARKGREKIHFFKVQRANQKRTEDWAKAINRKNQFGGLWMPTKNSFICGNHFLEEKPSDDSGHPDWIPSLKLNQSKKSSLAKKPKTEKDQKRHERLANRAKKGIENGPKPVEDSDQVKKLSFFFKSFVPLQRNMLSLTSLTQIWHVYPKGHSLKI